MAEKGRARGKVIEFTPRQRQRQRPKLKKLDYVDPAMKQLRKERDKKKKDALVRSNVIRNVGIFIGLCFVVYMLKYLL